MSAKILQLNYKSSSQNYFELLLDQCYPVLLESSSQHSGRWDIISANPETVVEASSRSILADKCEPLEGTARRIESEIKKYTSGHGNEELPFIAGAIGLISYGAGQVLVGVTNHSRIPAPQILVGIYQWALLQDHLSQRSWLVADAKLTETKWQQLVSLFSESCESNIQNTEQHFELLEDWQTSLDRKRYAEVFAQIQRYIQAGDCYQINLTRQFRAAYSGSPWSAYRVLATTAPAPFSAFMQMPGYTVVSCSPECFITIIEGEVTTKPIKGTRPRADNAQQDTLFMEELSRSEKDRAENLMIVDLMRNDLGKHCRTGSVTVPSLFAVESFSNVHHMVSTVNGSIESNSVRASLQLLLSCSPGGSVTGAPKKRAMEIIAELEPHDRSVYCGSLFYLNSNGNMNSSILIRSLLFEEVGEQEHDGIAYCWGGGAIVADSDLSTEFDESYYKVGNLLKALGPRAS